MCREFDPHRQALRAAFDEGAYPVEGRDASSAGDGWSDSQIVKALETSLATVCRTRQQLVEEGFEAALTRDHMGNLRRARIFDGEEEAATDRLRPVRRHRGDVQNGRYGCSKTRSWS